MTPEQRRKQYPDVANFYDEVTRVFGRPKVKFESTAQANKRWASYNENKIYE